MERHEATILSVILAGILIVLLLALGLSMMNNLIHTIQNVYVVMK